MNDPNAERNSSDYSEKDSFLRFYRGNDNFFENLIVWKAGKKITNREILFCYPNNCNPLSASKTADHIFPSPYTISDLDKEPLFHLATLTPPDGIRFVYAYILKTTNDIKLAIDKEIVIPKKSLLILSIESKYFHPSSFRSIFFHLYNKLSYQSFSEEIEVYMHPRVFEKPNFVELRGLPYDISIDAEIGRFHHFIFSILRVNQVLQILIHLLCSSSITVTSISTRQLSFGCFALLSLMFPIQWPMTFITALPENLIDYAYNPTPLIIGIPTYLFPKIDISQTNCCVILNLDFGHIDILKSFSYDTKYQSLIKAVEKLLEKELDNYKTTRIFPAFRIQIILWEFITGFALISADLMDVDFNQEHLDDIIATQLLKLNANTKSNENDDSVKTAFLESSVINHFCDIVKHGDKSKIPIDFFKIVQKMGNLMQIVTKPKK